MKKIRIITTGGTIQSEQKHPGVVSRKDDLDDLFALLGTREYEVETPIRMFSENTTPQRLITLLKAVFRPDNAQTCSGILITHGSDTLAYTAQLVSLLGSSAEYPIILIAAKRPADDPHYDGKENFARAIDLLDRQRKGVYVVSRHENGTCYLYQADCIQQADHVTDDFTAYQNRILGHWEGNDLHTAKNHPPLPQYPKLIEKFTTMTEPVIPHIWVLFPYPGLDYTTQKPENYPGKYILHALYHSGTANGEPHSPYGLPDFADRCHRAGKELYLAPLTRDKAVYETVLTYVNIKRIPDVPMERAWAMLILASWIGCEPQDLYELG